jgi:hypothetical protein
MRKIVWTFGIIAGVICGGMFFLNIPEPGEPMDFESGAVWGYVTMIVALSTIFFAVWQYRKNVGADRVGFKKSFLIGLYITLIASAIYVIGWEIYFNLYASDFGEQYVNYQREMMEQEGKAALEIEAILQPQAETMDLYANNFFFRAGMTFLEIFPVGLMVTLIVATLFGVFLKPKKRLERDSELPLEG